MSCLLTVPEILWYICPFALSLEAFLSWPLRSVFRLLHLLSLADFALQGFGVAIKLTLSGNNQLTHVSTYVFGVVVVGCIVVQMVCLARRKKVKRRKDFS